MRIIEVELCDGHKIIVNTDKIIVISRDESLDATQIILGKEESVFVKETVDEILVKIRG